jgi:hypothetical protein
MLEEPQPTHPDHIAMVASIDQRRRDKVEQARIQLQYKLHALQTKSIAERAQLHSQYMQTAREIRDSVLEIVNKEWYQIQRERRLGDKQQPNYLYLYDPKRSNQIARQTAYNKEVSILSGIAKHKGFPAAPEIKGAKPSEIDEDLRNMGVCTAIDVFNRMLT